MAIRISYPIPVFMSGVAKHLLYILSLSVGGEHRQYPYVHHGVQAACEAQPSTGALRVCVDSAASGDQQECHVLCATDAERGTPQGRHQGQ